MLVWTFKTDYVEVTVGAYHPDFVLTTMRIPSAEMKQLIADWNKYMTTGKQETSLLIQKVEKQTHD